jgi:glycosyltransferase involved in cell wall biosynthesis
MTFLPLVGHISNIYDIKSVGTLNNYQYVYDSEIGLDWSVRPVTKAYKRISYSTLGRILLQKIKNIDIFTALSKSTKEIYKNNTLKHNKINVIPNMVDNNFRETHSKKSQETNQTELLYVGSLKKIKGVDYLVKAMSYLPDNYRLSIVGDGPLLENLEGIVSNDNVGKKVSLEGFVDYEQIGNYYVNCDIFVHPGIWPEPFGRTIIEALQSGTPVVATNLGGPKDIVPDKEFLCEPKDPVALAECIKTASVEKKSEEYYRQYVEENYSQESVVNQITDIYWNIYEK